MAETETMLSFDEVSELPNETAQGTETTDASKSGEVVKEGDKPSAPNLDELFKEEPKSDQPDVFSQHGVDATNVAEVTKQAKAFTALTTLLGSNPGLLLGELEKANPNGFDAFMDSAAKLYEERYGQVESGDGSDKASGALQLVLNRLKTLEQRLEGRDQTDQQDRMARSIAEIKQNYESRRDALVEKVPNLSARDKRAIRALVNEEVAGDKAAQQRLTSGNYGDVLRIVKKVVTEYLTDAAADAKTKQGQREEVQSKGTKPLGTGAIVTGGERVSDEDSWETSIKSFADSLIKGAKK